MTGEEPGRQQVRSAVAAVIADVRRRGDEALLELTERWDGVRLAASSLRVPADVLARPPRDDAFTHALRAAAARVRSFHARVAPRSTLYEDGEGVVLGLRWTPVRSVGLYVPGGKAAYPSTLMMTAVPAQIAGVERIVVVSPPGADGEVSAPVLEAARVLGLKEVYRVGGAQAVAALALGTASIPRVDKIFGPGNAFVAEAKLQLFGEVGIDAVAGPSEVLVYADESAEPEWAAADLLAQAEHDEETRITLLAASGAVLAAVRAAMERQVEVQPRRAIIRAALAAHGRFEVVRGPEDAAERINAAAPEHLSLQIEDPWRFLPRVRNAGAIFLGRDSPVAVGDYYAGTNHVLPTGATARFASCLSVEDFMKRSSLAAMSLEFVRRAAGDVETLAAAERLPAHAASIAVRREHGRKVAARRGLRSVTPYALVEEDAEVKLNQNESPWDIPAEVKDEVARRLRDLPWNRYHQKLPEEFLGRLAADAGVEPDQVIAGSGSNLVLQWVFEAYGGPGSVALAPSPSFALYPLWAQATETRLEEVPLGARFAYDVDAFRTRIRDVRPRLVVLCLPNNPTGSELDSGGVERLAESAAEVGGLLVIDEAYREFSSLEHDRAALVRRHENVVLVRTFSKAYAAAGMRLGCLIAARDVARELRKLVPPFHVNLFAAVLGLVLLEEKALFAGRVRELVAGRDRLAKGIAAIPGCEVFPSDANFLLVRVEDAARVYEGLKARGILVRRPGSDPALRNCLRVNAGSPAENDRFLGALAEVARGPARG